MAYYSKRQFAELVGMPSKDLSNYIKRGHVILKNGKPCKCKDKKKCSCLIDDAAEINRLFIEKRGAVVASKPEQPAPVSEVKMIEAQKPAVNNRKQTSAIEKGSLTELHKQRAEKQNAKIDRENALLDAKITKLNEEVMPTEHAVHLIVAQAEGSKGAWIRATDTFITQFSAANQMTREEIVYWRKELTKIVNESVEEAAANAKKYLRQAARDYAGKKGKGERDDN